MPVHRPHRAHAPKRGRPHAHGPGLPQQQPGQRRGRRRGRSRDPLRGGGKWAAEEVGRGREAPALAPGMHGMASATASSRGMPSLAATAGATTSASPAPAPTLAVAPAAPAPAWRREAAAPLGALGAVAGGLCSRVVGKRGGTVEVCGRGRRASHGCSGGWGGGEGERETLA